MDDRISGPWNLEVEPVVLPWTLAFLVAIGLFFVPVLNGVLAGVIGASRDSGVKRTLGHAAGVSLLLWFPIWLLGGYAVQTVYGLRVGQTTFAFLCIVPLFATALIVAIVKDIPKWNPRALD